MSAKKNSPNQQKRNKRSGAVPRDATSRRPAPWVFALLVLASVSIIGIVVATSSLDTNDTGPPPTTSITPDAPSSDNDLRVATTPGQGGLGSCTGAACPAVQGANGNLQQTGDVAAANDNSGNSLQGTGSAADASSVNTANSGNQDIQVGG